MEDLDGKIEKPTDAMTEEELQFHYFKVHDYNNDNKLDGIELISALTHHNGLSSSIVFISPPNKLQQQVRSGITSYHCR